MQTIPETPLLSFPDTYSSEAELRAARTAFLDNTIAFYSADPKARRAEVLEVCQYLTHDGRRCAIGRYCRLPDESLQSMGGTVHGVWKQLQEALPKGVLELGENFLRAVQSLHDNPGNWGDAGLGSDGEDRVTQLRTTFC